jgi:hypothetical protein
MDEDELTELLGLNSRDVLHARITELAVEMLGWEPERLS